MELGDFIAAAEKWQALGSAVQEQARAVLDGQPMQEQNENALALIADAFAALGRYGVEDADEWADDVREYLHAPQAGNPGYDIERNAGSTAEGDFDLVHTPEGFFVAVSERGWFTAPDTAIVPETVGMEAARQWEQQTGQQVRRPGW